MVVGPDNYLDLSNILVNEIIGSPALFVAIMVLVLIVLAIKIGLRGFTAMIFVVAFSLATCLIMGLYSYVVVLLLGYVLWFLIDRRLNSA